MASLKKRGRVYYAIYRVGGRQKWKRLDTDEKIARRKLAHIIESREILKYGSVGRAMAWEPFKEAYLKQYDGQHPRQNRNHYARAFRELEAEVPLQRLSDITPHVLMEVKAEWQKRKRGIYVINKDLACIKTAMRYAEAAGWVQPQTWKVVKMIPEPKKGRLLYYSIEEYRKLREHCEGSWQTLVRLMARCGLRPGEARWLTWSDVDFARKRVHVISKNVAGEAWNPKTFEARWVPMPEDLVDHLNDVREHAKTAWVAPNEKGQRISEGVLTTYLRRLIKQAGLKGMPYTLRHTYGAHMASSGKVTLYELSLLMGHASERMTRIYAHLMPHRQQEAAAALPPDC